MAIIIGVELYIYSTRHGVYGTWVFETHWCDLMITELYIKAMSWSGRRRNVSLSFVEWWGGTRVWLKKFIFWRMPYPSDCSTQANMPQGLTTSTRRLIGHTLNPACETWYKTLDCCHINGKQITVSALEVSCARHFPTILFQLRTCYIPKIQGPTMHGVISLHKGKKYFLTTVAVDVSVSAEG